MRVVTVPNTLNAKTGLVCKYVGNRKDLERLGISELLEECMAFSKFHGYPEPLEGSPRSVGSNPTWIKSRNGAMKQRAKNLGEGSMVRVTTMTPSPTTPEGTSTSRSDVGKCPKCDGKMQRGLRLISYTEITVAKDGQFLGDYIDASVCTNCGYIELYKEKKE